MVTKHSARDCLGVGGTPGRGGDRGTGMGHPLNLPGGPAVRQAPC